MTLEQWNVKIPKDKKRHFQISIPIFLIGLGFAIWLQDFWLASFIKDTLPWWWYIMLPAMWSFIGLLFVPYNTPLPFGPSQLILLAVAQWLESNGYTEAAEKWIAKNDLQNDMELYKALYG